MAIPDYQSIMLPLLKVASDGNEYDINGVIELLAQQFGLSDNDRKELLPSGKQRKFDNRVRWARTYLQKAQLLSSTGRSKFRITERGKKVLNEHPVGINIGYLKQFSEFLDFYNGKESKVDEGSRTPQELIEKTSQTPQEILDTTYQSLRQTLAMDILEKIKNNTSKFFESLVVDLLVAMGYGGSKKDAGQAVGQSGDGGIDGIIKEDKLGLDAIYIQAKRWEEAVGRPLVQGFAGAYTYDRPKKYTFGRNELFVDGYEGLELNAQVSWETQVIRPRIVSKFDIEKRGRVITVESGELPSGGNIQVSFIETK